MYSCVLDAFISAFPSNNTKIYIINLIIALQMSHKFQALIGDNDIATIEMSDKSLVCHVNKRSYISVLKKKRARLNVDSTIRIN